MYQLPTFLAESFSPSTSITASALTMDEHLQDIDMPDADASTTEKEEASAEMVIKKRLYCAFPGLT
jgi:hypothetical protein